MYEDNSWYDKLPNETLEVCEENYNLFFEVMRERMLIWQRRFLEKRPAPWTENTILRDYKFTNVYRELDRNSQWQIHNILRDDTLDEINLVWKLMNVVSVNAVGETAYQIGERTTRRNLNSSYRQYVTTSRIRSRTHI